MLISRFQSSSRDTRQPKHRRLSTCVLLFLLAALGLAACGGGSSSAATRPHTDAKLIVISPTPNQVTGPDVPVQFQVVGATVSPPQKNNLAPNEGHIHVTLDGKLVAMAYTTSTQLIGLNPGLHTLQAEFVANDHLPFADRVIAITLFTVKS
jgi:hypothetical protein